jgi:hypothetical protein
MISRNKNSHGKVGTSKVSSVLLISFGAFEPMSSVRAQSGAYTLHGGAAALAGITNSTSTADQSGVFVDNSGNLTIGTVNVTTSGSASSQMAAWLAPPSTSLVAPWREPEASLAP